MRRLAAIACSLSLLATGCGGGLVSVATTGPDRPPEVPLVESTVYAADGSVIATLGVEHRSPVEREQLPDALVDAVVAAEDRRFWTHGGVDARGIVRAWAANNAAGEVVQGGSTITQQLVKNRYFPDAPQTLERKASEAHLARELEAESSKDEILTDYLNTVYLGDGAYGVQAAAETYFGVDVEALTLEQAALLAGLIRAPESASPREHPDRALAVRRRVLDAMVATGAVPAPRAEAAGALSLGVLDRAPSSDTRYPYFVEHVKRTLLADPALGGDEAERMRTLYGGGLDIRTTLDPAVQEAAEQAAALLAPETGVEVGIAVVRPGDGRLVAMVGGRDFAARQFDVATQARRQPGSTMKTFALVAALEDGRRLGTRLESGDAAIAMGPAETWTVRSATTGLLSLRQGLIRSSNGVYARLAEELGGGRIAETAQRMGVTADLGENPAVVLGGVREGVSPLDLASAYGTLAAGGVHHPSTPYTEVTDRRGWAVANPPDGDVAAVDPEVAWLTTSALRAAVEEGTGGAAQLDRPAAGKTGTSQDAADAWFVGYTPELAAAVWVGHVDDRTPLTDVQGVDVVDGGTWPARIWQHLMTAALEGAPVRDFARPDEALVTRRVDPTTGYVAGPYCPLTELRTGLAGELPDTPCPVHTSPALPGTSTARTPPPGP